MDWNEGLRYDYDLNSESMVLDIGGFDGTWAHNIHSKYGCNILVFEPVKEFYALIKERFAGNGKVHVYNLGLGTKDETLNIGVDGMSTSVLSKGENKIEIKDISPLLSGFTKIDLAKMNIEGAEYDLLDYIIEKGLQTKLVNIQVQFHNNISDYENRREKIRHALAKTHHLTYDFPVGLHENWEVNK